MGYSTDFTGSFACTATLKPEHIAYLKLETVACNLGCTVMLLGNVTAENPKLWARHIMEPDRLASFLPAISGQDSQGRHTGSLLDHIFNLVQILPSLAEEWDKSRYRKTAQQLSSDVLVLMHYCDPGGAEIHWNAAGPAATKGIPFSNVQKRLLGVKANIRNMGSETPSTCDRCSGTGDGRKLMRCGRCRVACIVLRCQRAAWREHKLECFEAL
jgi:hypothetical protein